MNSVQANDLRNALRDAADWVEQRPEYYCWMISESCNCGLVASFLLDKTPTLDAYGFGPIGSWGWLTRHSYSHTAKICTITGEPVTTVLHRLAAAGLEGEAFERLEFLGDRDVRRRAGIPLDDRQDKEGNSQYQLRHNFILYARAWAEMLEEQFQLDARTAKEVAHA